MAVLMGLDLGTTALKVALFDEKGKMLAVSTQEYDLLTPETNYVEEEPETYWNAFRDGIRDLKSQYDLTEKSEIVLAMSAQGETLFVLD